MANFPVLCTANPDCRCSTSAVRIPIAELEARRNELPAPYTEVQIASGCRNASVTYQAVRALKRIPILVPNPAPTLYPFLWTPSAAANSLVTLYKRCTVIDLGCGSGRDAIFLAGLGFKVIAIDRVPELIEEGRRQLQRLEARLNEVELEFEVANLQDWTPRDKVDAILSVYAYEPRILTRAKDWVKPGGQIVIETFSEQHWGCFGRPDPTKCPPQEELDDHMAPFVAERHLQFWKSDRHVLCATYRKP